MTISFTHPWRGGAFHWHEFKFNGGFIYYSYRFGPILVRVRA